MDFSMSTKNKEKQRCPHCGSKKISKLKGGSERCARCLALIMDNRPDYKKNIN